MRWATGTAVNRIKLFGILGVVFMVTFGGTVPTSGDRLVWRKVSRGITESRILTVSVDPQNPQRVLVGTDKNIYVSYNGGQDFRYLFTPSGEHPTINQIYFDPNQSNTIYAAAGSGLFVSQDNGRQWKRDFYPTGTEEKNVYSVIRSGDGLFAGTGAGLFMKSTQGAPWERFRENFSHERVLFLSGGQDQIFIATDQYLYRWQINPPQLEKIFNAGGRVLEELNDDAADDEEREEEPAIKFSIYDEPSQTLIVAAQKGIFISRDQGKSWEEFSIDGLPLEELSSMVCSGDYYFAGTSKGAYFYQDGRWENIYQGLETNIIYDLAFERTNLWAATNRGVFLLDVAQSQGDMVTSLKVKPDFSAEPTVYEVHQMAIRYAQVNADKITSWYKKAQKKALLPNLSVGLDRADTELYHWDTGPSPDVLSKGKDFVTWDVGLTWNLGELIWNDDFTSIDSRSKLMVEMRESILDQVTRLYFERRRLQIELVNSADSSDDALRVERELRLEELTALIDGYTGGEFARRLATGQ